MSDLRYPYRHSALYISEKYKEILFIPFGRVNGGLSAEHENTLSDTWPCDFGKLADNIREVLDRSLVAHAGYDPHKYGRANYPSYNASKAKSERSFQTDYVLLRLETDTTRDYAKGEVERITVTAKPTSGDHTYCLTGVYHLIDTKVAQLVLDIYEACMKIRN